MYTSLQAHYYILLFYRTLEESSIRDGTGALAVGGVTGVEDSFFTGGLQDVRVYAATLDQR